MPPNTLKLGNKKTPFTPGFPARNHKSDVPVGERGTSSDRVSNSITHSVHYIHMVLSSMHQLRQAIMLTSSSCYFIYVLIYLILYNIPVEDTLSFIWYLLFNLKKFHLVNNLTS